jgi:Tfp pilus assembly protein PilO
VRKLTKRETVLIFSLLMIMAIYAGFEYWYAPMAAQVKTLKAEKEQLAAEWEKVRSYAAQKDIKKEIDRLNAEIAAVKERMLAENQSGIYWKKVLEKTASAKVTAALISEQETETGKLLHFRVRGGHQAIYQFLQELEQIPYVHAVTEGDIRAGDTEAEAAFTVLIHAGE